MVEIIGLERFEEHPESLVALVSRVPSVGEELQIDEDAPQVVDRVRHRIHAPGFAPGDSDVDAVVFLKPHPTPRRIPRKPSRSQYE